MYQIDVFEALNHYLLLKIGGLGQKYERIETLIGSAEVPIPSIFCKLLCASSSILWRKILKILFGKWFEKFAALLQEYKTQMPEITIEEETHSDQEDTKQFMKNGLERALEYVKSPRVKSRRGELLIEDPSAEGIEIQIQRYRWNYTNTFKIISVHSMSRHFTSCSI